MTLSVFSSQTRVFRVVLVGLLGLALLTPATAQAGGGHGGGRHKGGGGNLGWLGPAVGAGVGGLRAVRQQRMAQGGRRRRPASGHALGGQRPLRVTRPGAYRIPTPAFPTEPTEQLVPDDGQLPGLIAQNNLQRDTESQEQPIQIAQAPRAPQNCCNGTGQDLWPGHPFPQYRPGYTDPATLYQQLGVNFSRGTPANAYKNRTPSDGDYVIGITDRSGTGVDHTLSMKVRNGVVTIKQTFDTAPKNYTSEFNSVTDMLNQQFRNGDAFGSRDVRINRVAPRAR